MAKALSAHKKIVVPSDPYFGFFKSFRNEMFFREGVEEFDPGEPISANFYSKHYRINEIIRNSDLRIPIKYNSIEDALGLIANLAERDAPGVLPLLSKVKAKSYDELYQNLIDIVYQVYGDEFTEAVGFKCTFVEQYLEVMLNTYSDLKCIYLIRDPRAIAASQKVFYDRHLYSGRGRYPLYYVVLQWRKSIAYLNDNIDRKQNVLLVRYEDVISNPEDEFVRICSFLGVEYDHNMADGSCYIDGSGNPWFQNSSYGTSEKISKRFVEKWRDVLSPDEIQFIEDLCGIEMELYGYERTCDDNIVMSCFMPPQEDIKKIDPWILDYVDEYIMSEENAEKEIIRRYFIQDIHKYCGEKSKYLDKVFIGKKYLAKLEALKKQAKSIC